MESPWHYDGLHGNLLPLTPQTCRTSQRRARVNAPPTADDLRDLCCCHCDATDTHRTLIVKGPGYNAIACFTVFRPNQTFVLGTFSKTWSQKGKGEVKLATYFPLQTNWVMWLDHWFDLCPWCFLFLCFFVVCKWDQSMRIWSWTWIWIWSDPDIFHSLF